MGKRYASVTEMVESVTGDKSYAQELEGDLASQSLARTLFVLRCQKGVTQAALAARLNWSQSRVSKLEHCALDKMKVGDLAAYIDALGLQTWICFHKKQMSAVEWVRFHALEVKKHLELLASLAHKDEGIYEGVKNFFGEALVNLLRIVETSAKRLPRQRRKLSSLQVCVTPNAVDEPAAGEKDANEIAVE